MELVFPGQSSYYQGKVRDVYGIDDKWVVMIASDRISAFDVILPERIPYKGQVLNQLAAYMLKACSGICPIWLLEVPAPNVSIGWKCQPFKIEMVVRGHLSGHAWRTYQSGKRILCGAALPEGLKENDPLPSPILTPSTKAETGHDEDISPEEIISRGLATSEQWETLCRYSLALFEKGKSMANERGLILVDTKYEFGILQDEICLMDEIHTPDSSRYFYREGFQERQQKGEKQQQLSKEFVREWLIANDFMGQPGQTVPAMSEEWVNEISVRYIQLFEMVTGTKFVKTDMDEKELESRINESLLRMRTSQP
jgi:phosphoribosylaminoimidazole-succinocarboxamide synthase